MKQLIALICIALLQTACITPKEKQTPRPSAAHIGAHIVVTNTDTFDYTNARITLNDNFFIEERTIPASKTITIGLMQFTDSEGYRFNLLMKPHNLSMCCTLTDGSEGCARVEF